MRESQAKLNVKIDGFIECNSLYKAKEDAYKKKHGNESNYDNGFDWGGVSFSNSDDELDGKSLCELEVRGQMDGLDPILLFSLQTNTVDPTENPHDKDDMTKPKIYFDLDYSAAVNLFHYLSAFLKSADIQIEKDKLT